MNVYGVLSPADCHAALIGGCNTVSSVVALCFMRDAGVLCRPYQTKSSVISCGVVGRAQYFFAFLRV